MKDKTLEQKVSLALYGAAIFFAFLFTVGLILKADLFSHWPTASEVYEVGRDALTLTAYFLAPAAALVLFSDWRLEHMEKSREEQGKVIYRLVHDIDKLLSEYEIEVNNVDHYKNDDSKMLDMLEKEIFNKFSSLREQLSEFDFDDDYAGAFRNKIKEIQYCYLEDIFYIERMSSALKMYSNPDKFNFEYIGESNEEFIERQQGIYAEMNELHLSNFANYRKLLEELKLPYKNLKIKINSPV